MEWSTFQKLWNYIPQHRCYNKGALLEICVNVLFAELKDKNSSHEDNEGKSTFLAITIELYKQKKKNKKITLKISNKLYQGSCGFK